MPVYSFCSSMRDFACSFFQIPRHQGHPCCSANGSHYQAHSGLSPPSYCPCRANNKKQRSSYENCVVSNLFIMYDQIFAPQLVQKAEPGFNSAPHDGHFRGSACGAACSEGAAAGVTSFLAPHFEQNT